MYTHSWCMLLYSRSPNITTVYSNKNNINEKNKIVEMGRRKRVYQKPKGGKYFKLCEKPGKASDLLKDHLVLLKPMDPFLAGQPIPFSGPVHPPHPSALSARSLRK